MRLLIGLFITLSLLAAGTATAEDNTAEEQHAASGSYDTITAFLRELAVKYGGLSEENTKTLDELFASVKKTLNDPNPASGVKVEGTTKKQWDDFNTSSPELEKKNQQLKEENQKRIDSL